MGRGSISRGPWSAAVAQVLDGERRKAGLSRVRLAAEAGFSKGRIGPLLDGSQPWYLEDVERMAGYLGLSVRHVVEQAERIVADDGGVRLLAARTGEREHDGDE